MKPFQPTKKQKADTDVLIEKWKQLLFLHEWHINCCWSEYDCRELPDCSAEVDADCTYKLAAITFYPRFFSRSEYEREHSIVHELCHCLTIIMKEPAYQALVKERLVLWREFKEADERCTQQVANVVHQLYLQRKSLP